ncbi:nuclear transport factor 2 family protein [Spirosoma radiotolerans]|uniref:nuclear transport factor 2 family protein n=1 Tax=Spirosoma radiotolerans TaxID=1379870 RepID=UPI000696824E|nr:nuclear transport factor 2 family protein [Spirosoma radiotolerans]
MKLLSVIILLTAVAFSPLYGQSKTDEQNVKQVINGFFQALSDEDIPSLRSYCRTDFTLLESGEIWSLDTLEAKIKPYFGQGARRINKIDFKKIVIKGTSAWVVYFNQADMELNARKGTINWLESAVLTKNEGQWKLTLLHSTTLPKKK